MTTATPLSIDWNDPTRDEVARHHYRYCLAQALAAVGECRAIVNGDPIDDNHELPLIEQLLIAASEAA